MSHAVAAVIHRRGLFGRIGGIARSDSERAIDAADDATDRSANNRPDRPGRVVADISAVRGAVGNALRLRAERTSQRQGSAYCEHNLELHAITSSVVEDAAREARNKAATGPLRGAGARRRRFPKA